MMSASILWIIAISTVMGHILTLDGAGAVVSAQRSPGDHNRILALLIINAGLLVLGCILETTPALLITSPDPVAGRRAATASTRCISASSSALT